MITIARRSSSSALAVALVAGALAAGGAGPAAAHPHVWVEVQTAVKVERGTFSSIRQRWTFDEFYSSMAIEGLDTNKDGKLDREELSELAKVNMDGLKEFGYFTVATLGGQRITFGEPGEPVLEHVTIESPPGPTMEPIDQAAKGGTGAPTADPNASGGFWSRAWDALLGKGEPPPPQKPKVLVLEFTLPLQQPVLTEAEGFEVSTYDPSFFIWFDLAKKDPTNLVDAPAGCVAEVKSGEKDQAELQRLNESFFNQVGGANIGVTAAKSITVRCPKS